MALFRSSNPALSRIQKMREEVAEGDRATYGGIAWKSVYFVGLTFIAAVASFIFSVPLMATNPGIFLGLFFASLIIALISGFVASLSVRTTAVVGSIYAVAEGLMVGFLSIVVALETYDPEAGGAFGGIVFAALLATISVFAVMMFLYGKGIIRVGTGFKKFMMSALIGIIVVNLLMWIFSMFSAELSEIFYGNGLFSIGISVIMVVFASLMILMDLNRMTEIVQNGLNKKYEWVAAFGLLVTLIWLYMEFLKLFLKLAQRSK